MRRSLGGDPGCGDTPGSGEGLQGGNPWDSRGQAEYLVWKRLCRPVLHNTGREGKADGGGREVGGERETLLLVRIYQSLGGSSCHGTGWAGRGLQADSLR